MLGGGLAYHESFTLADGPHGIIHLGPFFQHGLLVWRADIVQVYIHGEAKRLTMRVVCYDFLGQESSTIILPATFAKYPSFYCGIP